MSDFFPYRRKDEYGDICEYHKKGAVMIGI
jgi:hypothetical protein